MNSPLVGFIFCMLKYFLVWQMLFYLITKYLRYSSTKYANIFTWSVVEPGIYLWDFLYEM